MKNLKVRFENYFLKIIFNRKFERHSELIKENIEIRNENSKLSEDISLLINNEDVNSEEIIKLKIYYKLRYMDYFGIMFGEGTKMRIEGLTKDYPMTWKAFHSWLKSEGYHIYEGCNIFRGSKYITSFDNKEDAESGVIEELIDEIVKKDSFNF